MTEPMELAFEERGAGPLLLFVHGFPFDRTMWIPQLAGLAKVRTCVAADLRGHGLSTDENPKDYSMDMFADDLARTIQAIGADEVDLCGMSMGGYVLFAFWRRHRQLVRSLIFCDTKAEPDSDEAKAGREKSADLVTSQGMEALHDGGLGAKLVGSAPPPEAVEKIHQMFLSTPPAVAAADLLAMRDRPDSSDDLAAIDVPCLWLHGEEDALMPVDGARASAERIKSCSFVTIPEAGHCAPLERPEAFNDALRDFLSGI